MYKPGDKVIVIFTHNSDKIYAGVEEGYIYTVELADSNDEGEWYMLNETRKPWWIAGHALVPLIEHYEKTT